MMHQIINDTPAPKAVGTYSQGAMVNGFYYFSGQIGLNPKTMELVEGFEQQINQIFLNIDSLLKGCSLERSNIIKTTVFVTDLSNFPKVNSSFEQYFKPPYPARSTVEVKGLPKGSLVEIEVIAYKK